MDWTQIAQLCTGLLVLTLKVENQTPHTEYWCKWGSIQDDLYYTCFIIDCLLQLHTMKKRHHPSPTSNEFLHADSIQGSMHLKWAFSEKDKDWAAIIAYYVTTLQNWSEKEADAGWRIEKRRSRGDRYLVQDLCLKLLSVHLILQG